MQGPFERAIDRAAMKDGERFIRIYARNCIVKRIGKNEAAGFIDSCHNLKYTACRYHYGIFVLKQGHAPFPGGTMVAAAGFSNARSWKKDGRSIRSYEWVRYASLPGTRVLGGMGKILNSFIEDVKPDDIMSYADTAWSDGSVYKKLGFKEEGVKTFDNGGTSRKFRLKLVEYE